MERISGSWDPDLIRPRTSPPLKITSRQPHPTTRPITPFLVPGGMDIRGEARSATTGNLWRWVFLSPRSGSRFWHHNEARGDNAPETPLSHGNGNFQTPTRPAQGFPQPGFVSKTDKTDRHFRNGASRRVCYVSKCLKDAKTLKTDDHTRTLEDG